MWRKISVAFFVVLACIEVLVGGCSAFFGIGWAGGYSLASWILLLTIAAAGITFGFGRLYGWIGRRELVDIAHMAMVISALTVVSSWAADRWGFISIPDFLYPMATVVLLVVSLYSLPGLEAWKNQEGG